MNTVLENVWNSIWKGDSYSTYELRCEKAKQKVAGFGDMLALTNRSLCVDLGCGGGYVSYEISSKYKCKVMGIDFSETAIKVAKETFENSHTNCFFEKGTVTDIPLPDNSADAVLCVGVLEHIEDITSALSEVRRILNQMVELLSYRPIATLLCILIG